MSPPEIKVSSVGERMSRALSEKGSEHYRYIEGYVVTAHGVVGVYSEARMTGLTMAHDGQEYRGQWPRGFTERSLITLCKSFAEEIAGRLGL